MTSSTHRVKYDLIAHLYDEPGRDYDIDPHLVQFLSERTNSPSRQRDLSDFLPLDKLSSLMKKADFCDVHIKREYKQGQTNLREFLNYALQRHRTSQFMVIQDKDYEIGIAKLEECLAKLGN